MKKATDPDVLLLQAAADQTRLAIIRQLSAEGPVCACDFTECCAVSQPTVSHHLKVLREAGWITGERRGTWIWYSLRQDAVDRFAELVIRHRRGLLWKAIRATSSLPGIAVPVVQDGELLVDGGVVDNLPGSIMGRFMSGKVIVVDVNPESELAVNIDYADVPGVWRLLWSRLNPFSKKIRFPSISDVLLRTVTVSSLPARAQSLADADLVLRPPINQYGMMDFASTEEIAAKAYVYTLQRLGEADLPGIKTEDNAGHAD